MTVWLGFLWSVPLLSPTTLSRCEEDTLVLLHPRHLPALIGHPFHLEIDSYSVFHPIKIRCWFFMVPVEKQEIKTHTYKQMLTKNWNTNFHKKNISHLPIFAVFVHLARPFPEEEAKIELHEDEAHCLSLLWRFFAFLIARKGSLSAILPLRKGELDNH